MKKMKILISVLALALATLTPMSSFATDGGTESGDNQSVGSSTSQTDNDETSKDEKEGMTEKSEKLELSQVHNAEYKIKIPSGVGNLKENKEFYVSASGLLEYGKKLTVSVESENEWKLKDTKHDDVTVEYTMKFAQQTGGEGESAIYGNEITIESKEMDLLTLSCDDRGGTVRLTVTDIGSAKYAGEYKDTLTFRVKTDSDINGIVDKEDIGTKPVSTEDNVGNTNEGEGDNQSEEQGT